MRAIVAPPPGGRTFPTTTSLDISAKSCRRTVDSSSLKLGRVDLSALQDLLEDGGEEVLGERVLETTLLGLMSQLGPFKTWRVETTSRPPTDRPDRALCSRGYYCASLAGTTRKMCRHTLVTAVLAAETMTTSSADLIKTRARPREGIALVMF
jgi:hypothetical protein